MKYKNIAQAISCNKLDANQTPNNNHQTENPKIGKILIVDDEEDIRTILQFEMEEAGYETIMADCGNNALQIMKDNPDVQVIISDIRMPNGSGIFLLDSLRKDKSDTPYIIFITGYSDIAISEIYQRGANAILNKPIEFPILIELTKHFMLSEKERWGRSFHRSEIKLQVILSSSSVDSNHVIETSNIGRGGMFLLMKENFPKIDEQISFKISMPLPHKHNLDRTPVANDLEGIGIVRWVRNKSFGGMPTGIGVEFIYLTEDSKKKFLDFLCQATIKAFIPESL